MESVGVFLKRLRGTMTLREAAERSGLSHSYIRYLENGKRPGSNTPINPTPDSLRGLAKAYNYSYEELMKKCGYTDELKNNDLIEETEEEKTIRETKERMIRLIKDFNITSEEEAKVLEKYHTKLFKE